MLIPDPKLNKGFLSLISILDLWLKILDSIESTRDFVSKNADLGSKSPIRKLGLSSKFLQSDLTGMYFLWFSIPDMLEPSQSFNDKNTNIESLE